MRRTTLTVFAALLATGMVLSGCTTTTSTETPLDNLSLRAYLIKPGTLAPNFTLKSMSGSDVTLDALRGQVVVLDFWAHWCDACEPDLAKMEEIDRAFRTQGAPVTIIPIEWRASPDEGTARSSISKFIEEEDLTLDSLYDDKDGSVKAAYGVKAVPTMVIIGPDGTVTAGSLGSKSPNWIQDHIAQALGQPST